MPWAEAASRSLAGRVGKNFNKMQTFRFQLMAIKVMVKQC